MANERNILDRIALIQRNLSGITKAFDDVPRNLEINELPAFVNFVSASAIVGQRRAADQYQMALTIEMRLHVKRFSSGTEYEAQRLLIPLVTSVQDEFFARQRLQYNDAGLADVNDTLLTTTLHNQLLTYADHQYIGAIFNLQIVYTRIVVTK